MTAKTQPIGSIETIGAKTIEIPVTPEAREALVELTRRLLGGAAFITNITTIPAPPYRPDRPVELDRVAVEISEAPSEKNVTERLRQLMTLMNDAGRLAVIERLMEGCCRQCGRELEGRQCHCMRDD